MRRRRLTLQGIVAAVAEGHDLRSLTAGELVDPDSADGRSADALDEKRSSSWHSTASSASPSSRTVASSASCRVSPSSGAWRKDDPAPLVEE